MKRKLVSELMLILLLIGMPALQSKPVEAEVIIIVPEDYPTIQSAINVASLGDTIFVKAGIYCESIVVNKTVLLFGENRDTTIIDANGTGMVINVMANNVTIEGITIRNSGEWDVGIFVSGYNGVRIRNNNITGNGDGIWLSGSSDNVISGNNITKNRIFGIICTYTVGPYGVVSSSNNTICGNCVNDNDNGIDLDYASDSTLRNNRMSDNRKNFGVGGLWDLGLSHYFHDIDSSNTVDGKPVYYLVNKKDLSVPEDAGYVALVNSTNITVQNLHLKNNTQGLLLAYTKNSLITGNTITGNQYGIRLDESSNSTVSGNNITDNGDGVWLSESTNNIISGNNITANSNGIWFSDSSNNNWMSGNNILDNGLGIKLYASTNSTLRNTRMSGKQVAFSFWGFLPSHYFHDIDSSNTVDGKPVYYLVNKKDLSVPEDAGYVALVNSTNITVQNLHLKNNTQGLLLAYTKNSLITGNTITDTQEGIHLEGSYNNIISVNTITDTLDGIWLSDSSNNIVSENDITTNSGDGVLLSHSSHNNNILGNNITANSNGIHLDGGWLGHPTNNTIYGNNITDNMVGIRLSDSDHTSISGNEITGNSIGIDIWVSDDNTIYHNNFLNNNMQIFSFDSTNIWDDGYLSGGNYWSNYNGTDLDGDGIGDTSYLIDATNQDRYPLMHPYVLLGDLNTDDKVDVKDIAIFALAFGSYPEHPRWNPIADTDNNMAINILDGVIIAKNFGSTIYN